MNKDSIWFSLRNEKFRTLWLATLMSSSAVAAYNTAAVWLMNSLARSSFFLSLIPVVTSLAFLLFTLPAGTIADQITRAKVISLINLNLALFCFCFGFIAWLGWINPGVLLFGVFFLGIGLAFNGPAMAAIVPDLVSDAELSSAVTLGSLQINISSMVGPAVGGLIILLIGPGGVFLVSTFCFLIVVLAAQQISKTQRDFARRRENFWRSLVETFQMVRRSSAIWHVVGRSFIFSLFVSLIPALFPVLALRHFRVGAAHLGVLFTSLAAGSVFGAVFVVPKLRVRFSSDAVAFLSTSLLVVYLFVAGHVGRVLLFTVLAPIGGIAWTVGASEFWLVEQRVTSQEARGRANAVYMLLGNVGLLLGGLLWGWLATVVGLDLTFHIATLAILLSMPVCVMWSLDAVDGMWQVDVSQLSRDRVHLVEPVLKQAIQVSFAFRVPAEATQRFEDLATQARSDFVRWGASRFRILNAVAAPYDYRVEIVFSSEPQFREFDSDQGANVSDAWKQAKDCATQTEYELALIDSRYRI